MGTNSSLSNPNSLSPNNYQQNSSEVVGVDSSEPQWKQWKPRAHVTRDIRWRRFKQYINYKPSLAYFVVGLMGVLLIEAHVQAIKYANALFDEFVDVEFRNLIRKAGIKWNTAINVMFNGYYIDYANAILDLDKDIDAFLVETQSGLEDVLSIIEEYISDAKTFISSYVGSFVCDLLWEILTCLTPIFDVPTALMKIANFWPTSVDLPILPPPTFIMLNFSRFDLGIDDAQNEINKFSQDYEKSISENLNFFIFLLCWGCGVPIFGILSTSYLMLRDRGYCVCCTAYYYKAERGFRRKFLKKYKSQTALRI